MATTSPDNIQYPVGTDQVAPLADHFKNLADSTQAALNTKADSDDPRLSDERTPLDNSVTSAKIANGAIVNEDINAAAAIDKTKISGTAITAGDTGTVTSTMIANGTIIDADINASAAIAATKVQGTLPTGGGAGQVLAKSSTTDYATTWVDGTALPASQVKQLVKNMTGSAIPKGSVVYFSGADGTNILISLSDADTEATSSKTVGFTESTIANAGTGYVVSEGLISGIDTGSATAGQSVWLSGTAGGYVFGAPPAKPAHSVYLGLVTRANANTGEIFVKVQNGFELEELHNVNINSGTLANGQALTYDSSSQMWKNATPISALAGLSDVTISGPVAGEKLVYNGTKWVNLASAGSAFTVSDTAPSLTTASEGDAWVNSSNGTMAVCYVDPDGTKLWLQVQANSALEASILARLGQLESSAIALGTYSPNYIINGAFDINQRNLTTLTNTNAYGYDRWIYYCSGGTCTYEAKTFTPGELAIGTINPTNYARLTSTGQTATNSILQFQHKTEDVRTLAGKTATFSFYAKVASGTPSVTVELGQNFGTGGSTTVWTPQKIVLTGGSSWTRYSVTFNVPSVSEKTIGSGSCMEITYFLSAGSDHNVRSLSLGIQSNTFDIAGVQFEAGSTATSFRRNAPSIQAELAACQRYYQRITAGGIYGQFGDGWTTSTTNMNASIQLPVPMRTVPTSIDYGGAFEIQLTTNAGYTITSLSLSTVESTNTRPLLGAATSSVPANYAGHWRSQNNSSSYVGFSAEL